MQLTPNRRTRPATLASLPDGEAGTIATLELMRRIVHRYKPSPAIRELAIALTNDLPNRDWVGEVNAVADYVRENIRYVRDVAGLETVQTPDVTLELAAGDCDDQSTLVATLLESIGHRTRFVAVGWRAPHRYSHVYPEILMKNGWMGVDTTREAGVYSGFQPTLARLTVE